ncbi:glycosyltransferase [Salinicoccus roseus]|uniref:glycosyltransferase n=1 Tax=Salinicoccus roseus TaxID=45670 RepID=UPI000F4FADD4|nr:glycosyltransferase [Salinicoccus roseus]RPE54807.1 glycosyl transferase family 2 [Salinicoccus roseus]
MDRKELQKNLQQYKKDIRKDFSQTLNTMINDLNPSINIHEYSPNYLFKQDADPFYYMRIEELKRHEVLDKFKKVAEELPNSNGSRYYKRLNYKIGMIADEFLFESFKDVADVEYISRDGRENLKEYDFVIFATTWRGVDGSWRGAATANGPIRRQMITLAEQYNEKGIPTVFYSKEDPVNYNLFKSLAKHCRYIYTTASEVVDNYKFYTGNENVKVLQFGVNPMVHNPVGSRSKMAEKHKDELLFAGSWLTKYPVRMSDTKRLFDSIVDKKAPFTIIDRNLELRDPRYQFPSKYLEYLTPPVSHDFLMKLHKIFRWSINMNSVKYSETMFANRVYELQAFGNILLSNYNTGINNMFPNVRMTHAPDDFKVIYQTDEDDLRDLQAKGIRNVMSNHTTFDRIISLAEDIGLDIPEERNNILVVLEEDTAANYENFERQLYGNKTCISRNEMAETDLTSFDYITFFSENYIYEEYYLEDMISAFKYTDVNFVTKDEMEEAHNYINNIRDKSKTMMDMNKFQEVESFADLVSGYNLDGVEIINRDEYNEKAQEKYVDKELSVIVPIHNNGTYLEEKCFASLKRSSSFEKMEIIFVNDGSTDETTIKIINRLLRRHPDIVYYEYDSGSGSASRPRNKGVRLATTDYITYLDPDNEALGDGYHMMLETMKNQDVDMVVGNIIKEDNEKRTAGKYTGTIKKYNDNRLFISDPREYLIRCGMRVQSIQALIVRKSVILDNDIIMVEGAAGQDTMFFQELVLNCNSIQGINKFIHVYYAAVEGSVTNTISKKFFDKYYKLEIERIPYLEKYDLMDVYLEERFNFYIRKWYKPRLERVEPSEREEAVARFLEIIDLYEPYQPVYEKEVEMFLDSLRNENSRV